MFLASIVISKTNCVYLIVTKNRLCLILRNKINIQGIRNELEVTMHILIADPVKLES